MIKKIILLSLMSLLVGCSNKLPSCKSSEVKSVVKDIVNNKSYVGQFINLNDIKEKDMNKEDQIRLCSGTVVTSIKSLDVYYSIKWQNKETKQFSVEMVTQ